MRLLHYLKRAATRFGEKALVASIEFYARLFCLLDPRTHCRALRVKRIEHGAALKPDKKFAVLVLFADRQIPPFTWPLIRTIARGPFNLVVVSNADKCPEKERLLRFAQVLIERANIGRDFGAYKDGIRFLYENFGTPERLLIVNDSLYCFEEGLPQLVAALDEDHDFIGASEIHEIYYHVASFMISFGRRVLEHGEFQRFWSRYIPITTRSWAIEKGEKDLTATLIAAGFAPRILFKADDLLSILAAKPPDALMKDIDLLARRWRGSARELASVDPETKSSTIARAIVSTIRSRNQMHTGGLLFCRDLKMPIMKRDLVYRDIFLPTELREYFAANNTPLAEEIIADATKVKVSDRSAIWQILHRNHAI